MGSYFANMFSASNQSVINPNSIFIRSSLTLVIFLLLIISFFSKTAIFLAANFYHTPALDSFFTYYTYLGDGAFAILVILAVFLYRKRELAIKLLLTFVLSGLLAQLLKKLFHAPRPKAFLSDHIYQHFITGVTHTGMNSFPSGHATTAFAIATTIAFNISNQVRSIIIFFLAAGVAYSRVYLGQHFVEDVLAGIILGIFTAAIVEYVYFHYIMKIKFIQRFSSSSHEQPSIGL